LTGNCFALRETTIRPSRNQGRPCREDRENFLGRPPLGLVGPGCASDRRSRSPQCRLPPRPPTAASPAVTEPAPLPSAPDPRPPPDRLSPAPRTPEARDNDKARFQWVSWQKE